MTQKGNLITRPRETIERFRKSKMIEEPSKNTLMKKDHGKRRKMLKEKFPEERKVKE